MIVPVILSGGSGTRLWPLSRAMYPKQFIRFFDKEGLSMFGSTLRQLDADEQCSAPLVLCNTDHRFLVSDELARAGVEPEAIILEPIARNTAAAAAVAALVAVRRDPEAILAIMPSDHILKDREKFLATVKRAAAVAAKGKLTLLGITPGSPHTGYGYIRCGAPLNGSGAEFQVDAFVEKPNLKTAEGYLAAGGHLWNSGIFVVHGKTLLDEFALLAPDVLKAATLALDKATEDLGFLRLDRAAFGVAPNISIDYAVMEKTSAAVVLPLDAGWNDVGSWSSMWEISQHDSAGNAVNGETLLLDTSDCYVHSERSLVSMIGVKDLVVVDTPDALLVAAKDRVQDVSNVVALLRKSNRREHEQHLRNMRPWGFFETLSQGDRFQVKLLHVKPGARLSMQMHHHRSEHWIVVRGTAKVSVGETEKLVRENESVYISATDWHRVENPGKVPLEMIEVQIGSYLGEDDIIRSEDIYHRSAEETK